MIPKPPWHWVHGFLGLNWLANGVWMTFAPAHWYAVMPQTEQTGPLNEHFVRDYGTVFFLIGAAVLFTLARGTFTRSKHLWVLWFFIAHASMHVWDMFAGRLQHDHLTSGFPLVMVPVVALGVLTHSAFWQKNANTNQH